MTCSTCTYWNRNLNKGWTEDGFGKCSIDEELFSPRTKIYVLSLNDHHIYHILTRNDFFCAEHKEAKLDIEWEKKDGYLSLDWQGK